MSPLSQSDESVHYLPQAWDPHVGRKMMRDGGQCRSQLRSTIGAGADGTPIRPEPREFRRRHGYPSVVLCIWDSESVGIDDPLRHDHQLQLWR